MTDFASVYCRNDGARHGMEQVVRRRLKTALIHLDSGRLADSRTTITECIRHIEETWEFCAEGEAKARGVRDRGKESQS